MWEGSSINYWCVRAPVMRTGVYLLPAVTQPHTHTHTGTLLWYMQTPGRKISRTTRMDQRWQHNFPATRRTVATANTWRHVWVITLPLCCLWLFLTETHATSRPNRILKWIEWMLAKRVRRSQPTADCMFPLDKCVHVTFRRHHMSTSHPFNWKNECKDKVKEGFWTISTHAALGCEIVLTEVLK